MEAREAVKRSVRSLQRIYAFVVALAVARAIEATFITGGQLAYHPERIAIFMAFAVTVVPFFHGMNRHLDRCYVERHDPHVQRALLFDFAVFFIEAGLLFALAASAQSGLFGFLLLVAILAIDIVWGLVSNWIHYEGAESTPQMWVVINSVAIIAILAVYYSAMFPDDVKAEALAVVALLRSVADYRWNWELYFPPVES